MQEHMSVEHNRDKVLKSKQALKDHIMLLTIISKTSEVKSNLTFMDPCIVDDSAEIPTRCSFVIEFIIPKFIEGSTCFEWHTAHH